MQTLKPFTAAAIFAAFSIGLSLAGGCSHDDAPAADATTGGTATSTAASPAPDAAASAAPGVAGPPPPPAAAPAASSGSFDTRPFKGNGKVVKTADGLQYEDMTIGKGATAVAGKAAVVQYTGTLTDGTKFDSSRDRNDAFSFVLGTGGVIKGWDEGVAGMKVGGRRKLTIPSDLGYGDQGQGPIPPKATLVFDVELMGVGTN